MLRVPFFSKLATLSLSKVMTPAVTRSVVIPLATRSYAMFSTAAAKKEDIASGTHLGEQHRYDEEEFSVPFEEGEEEALKKLAKTNLKDTAEELIKTNFSDEVDESDVIETGKRQIKEHFITKRANVGK